MAINATHKIHTQIKEERERGSRNTFTNVNFASEHEREKNEERRENILQKKKFQFNYIVAK